MLGLASYILAPGWKAGVGKCSFKNTRASCNTRTTFWRCLGAFKSLGKRLSQSELSGARGPMRADNWREVGIGDIDSTSMLWSKCAHEQNVKAWAPNGTRKTGKPLCKMGVGAAGWNTPLSPGTARCAEVAPGTLRQSSMKTKSNIAIAPEIVGLIKDRQTILQRFDTIWITQLAGGKNCTI